MDIPARLVRPSRCLVSLTARCLSRQGRQFGDKFCSADGPSTGTRGSAMPSYSTKPVDHQNNGPATSTTGRLARIFGYSFVIGVGFGSAVSIAYSGRWRSFFSASAAARESDGDTKSGSGGGGDPRARALNFVAGKLVAATTEPTHFYIFIFFRCCRTYCPCSRFHRSSRQVCLILLGERTSI